AVAAGRLPGADISALPVLDTIGAAPRDKQVDAVVAAILNGMASPDTRAVLLSGEHPMLAGSGKREAGGARPDGNIPQLTGLPQIVGLALGSPEFQRR
ncbi:MAG: hypothetical protein ACJ791_01770, partial [Gemmatimonadaceae bacterium]